MNLHNIEVIKINFNNNSETFWDFASCKFNGQEFIVKGTDSVIAKNNLIKKVKQYIKENNLLIEPKFETGECILSYDECFPGSDGEKESNKEIEIYRKILCEIAKKPISYNEILILISKNFQRRRLKRLLATGIRINKFKYNKDTRKYEQVSSHDS